MLEIYEQTHKQKQITTLLTAKQNYLYNCDGSVAYSKHRMLVLPRFYLQVQSANV